MAVWTVYLSLCLLIALTASGANDTFLEIHKTNATVGREASEASPSPNYCWAGWSDFRSRCFKLFYYFLTWSDAEKLCLQYDGNLASVHSYEEYAFIQDLIRSETQATTRAWIGGNDAVQEGVWFWSDGTKMDHQIWSPNQPDNTNGKEHCLEMNYDNGNWNDDPCTDKKLFVCVKRTSM